MSRTAWASALCLALSAAVAAASPVVPAFERFHGGGNLEGGRLLLAELGCTACHAAPAAWQTLLAAPPGPVLAGVGSRRSVQELEEIVRAPDHWKAGTTMPTLKLAGEGTPNKIAAYLSSLREEIPHAVPGDRQHGDLLYHRVGCIACHVAQPAGSTPSYDALVSLLLDPLRTLPDGRMPSLHLTAAEAADIASYLVKAQPLAPAPGAGVEEGRQEFRRAGCVACHRTARDEAPQSARPLAELSPQKGCLSPQPPAGAADYQLSETQRWALIAAVEAVRAEPPALTAAQQVDWRMERLNCYACHARQGKGGVQPGDIAFFAVNDAGIESLGEMAHLPPALDHAGRKLTPAWFARLFWGEGGSVRPYMEARMPAFGRTQMEPLIPLLAEADRREPPIEIDVSGLLGHQRAENGRKLMGTSGVSCVSCHGLKERASLGPPVIRLTHTVERLQAEYFKELVLDPQVTQPGTVMPPLFTGRKTADKDIEAIWTYLREIDGQPLPEGLLADTDFELKPSVAGRPIVFRSFVEGVGTHAIGIGFPAGVNACFDSLHCQWAVLWKGRFLDAMENWQDRAMKPIRPLGTALFQPPAETAPRQFRGYRLERDGTPVMLYTEGGQPVEDRVAPGADGQSLVRTVKRGDAAAREEVWSW